MIFDEDVRTVKDYKETMVNEIVNSYSDEILLRALNEWLKNNNRGDEDAHIFVTKDLIDKLISNNFNEVKINNYTFSMDDLKSYETFDFTSKYFYIDTIIDNKVLISMNSLDEFKRAYIEDILDSMSLGAMIENYVLNY